MNKRFFIIVAIVLMGVIMMLGIIKSTPKPSKKIEEEKAPLVEVNPFTFNDLRPSWEGGAAVNGNTSVKLVAQVSGQILSINPNVVPGSYVKKGVELAVIDDANYQLVYEQKKAKVVQAQSSLDMELAQVENAKKDYQRTGMKLNPAGKALALRQPQLASAKAALAIANSELKKAKLDLQRTRLTMPFDGHILSQNLSEGAFVNNSMTVFEVLNAQAYWLEVKVPQTFVDVLDANHPVEVSLLGGGVTRQATILNVFPQVDAADRQVRLLIGIEDPLLMLGGQSNLPVIRYNEYVKVKIFAKSFTGAAMVKSDALNLDGFIWVVDAKQQLQQRKVNVLYSGRAFSWVSIASQPQDQALLSQIDSPKVGMSVRLLSGSEDKTVPTTEVDASNVAELEVSGQ